MLMPTKAIPCPTRTKHHHFLVQPMKVGSNINLCIRRKSKFHIQILLLKELINAVITAGKTTSPLHQVRGGFCLTMLDSQARKAGVLTCSISRFSTERAPSTSHNRRALRSRLRQHSGCKRFQQRGRLGSHKRSPPVFRVVDL